MLLNNTHQYDIKSQKSKHVKIKTIISIFIYTAFLTSCIDATNTPKQEILNQLAEAAKNKNFLFGHQDSYFYGHSWNNTKDYSGTFSLKSDIQEVCGSYPAVLGCDIGHLELEDEKNLDGVPFDMMRQAIIKQDEMGGISTISWHSRNPVTKGDSWDVTCDTVVRAILSGHSHNAVYSQWLERVADFLISLKDENGDLIPVIFRPYHEHTGSWFWWGEKLSSAEDYKTLWKYTYDYLTNKGLDNLIWAYSASYGNDEAEYLKKYPGDDYVDLIGFDIYQYGKQNSKKFQNSLNKELKMIAKIAQERNKLLAVTEVGYESIPDPKWWTECLLESVKEIPISYVLLWRNAWDKPIHHYGPYRGSSSSEDFITFYNLEETIFINDIK